MPSTRSSSTAPRLAEEGFVRIELDLPHELLRPSGLPVLRQLQALLREREIEEEGSVLLRTAELLDLLAEAGYGRVDHWEVVPGGWLPLPEAGHRGRIEPVGHLVRALKSRAWAPFAKADGFRVRLSSDADERADAHVLRLHRERQHSITVDLWGPPSGADVHRLVERMRKRFEPLKTRIWR
jgi:hypothetical protein